MNQRIRTWLTHNGPLLVVVVFAILALLYLGDDIVRDRQSRISLKPIPPTLQSGDPTQGNKDATSVIFEFADFTCSACKDQAAVLKQIINDYGKDVLLVWKDAPLNPLTPESRRASVAAYCAGKQNKFWEMHDKLFEHQLELGSVLYATLAKELQLNESQFASCLAKPEALEKVNRNYEEARAAKVTATPTFYIDGQKVEGFQEYNDILTSLAI